MPTGARRLVVALAAATAVGATALSGAAPASAAPARCSHPDSLQGAALTRCIGDLHTRAEAAGRRAAKADEAYLQAQQATHEAQDRLAAADARADRAADAAERSRARAGLVAANLARGAGAVGPTTQVLLSGQGASTVLYHLSRMSELGVDTSRVASDARRDQRAADDARAGEAVAAEEVQDSERAAERAYTKAKRRSDAARHLVEQAEAQQARITGAPAAGGDAEALADLPADASKAARVVAFARAQIGEPYVFGAAGSSSWDCSGLSMMALQSVDRSVGGHSSNAQYHLAAREGLLVPYSAAQPGDLVFYGSGDIYHVAVYSGGGNMVEAPYPGRDVREVPVRSADRAPMVARFTG